MSFFDIVLTALKNIYSSKIRTLLTMFGIVIGIAAVITVTSVGEGSNASIVEQFEEMGANTITVSENNSRDISDSDRLSNEDVEMFRSLDYIEYVSAVSNYNTNIKLLDKTEVNSASITGVEADYFNINKEDLLYGRFIMDADIENESNVVVITNSTAMKVFGEVSENVLGQDIELKTWKGTRKYTVIGIIDNPDFEEEMLYPDEYTENLIMPIISLQNLTYEYNFSQILLYPTGDVDIDNLTTTITTELENFRGSEGNYRVRSMMDMLSGATEILSIVTMLVSAAAAISLVVGGVGVMNIMLVTVTERTKEIGIRKALGAKRYHILLQFLVESIVVTGLGGFLGIVMGIQGGKMAGNAMGTGSIVTTEIIILAFLVSTTIGVVFGVYPANKASKLNPVDALRYE